MIRPSSWLPLVALSLLVVLTLWLNQLVQPQAGRADGSLRHDPDLMVENFNARALDVEGQVQYTLAAKKMVHYPDDNSAVLEAVALEAFEPRQPKMKVTADRGRLEEGGERVLIEGNVVIVRDGDKRIEPLRIMTDKLTVLPDEGKASTRSEVRLESPSAHAVATGLDLDNRARTVRLEKVHATYKPPQR